MLGADGPDDQTQHVISRIDGEFDAAKPRVVVFMIGTNNTTPKTGRTLDEIAAANKKIVEMIRANVPAAMVLLLAIFPRGPRKNTQGVVTPAAVRMRTTA